MLHHDCFHLSNFPTSKLKRFPHNGQSRHYRLPLVLPYSTAPLKGVTTSLRFTQIHFAQWSYERVLRLQRCFTISDLARLGEKPRFHSFSLRNFACNQSLMLFFVYVARLSLIVYHFLLGTHYPLA